MLVDLVRVTTSDGIRLDGALRRTADQSARFPVDACLLLHGTGSNFYGSTLLEALADRFFELGIAPLTVNTRGHDGSYVAATPNGPVRLGAAYERVADCRLDLAAWLDWLVSQGFPRILLAGHSLGAVKAIFGMSQEPHSNVVGVVAVSPPCLSCEAFRQGPAADEFLSTLGRAELSRRYGNEDELMEVQFPLPYQITAAGYLDKYGPGERFNVLRHLNRLTCPALVTYGSVETESNVAFRGMPEAVDALALPDVQVATVAGADHFYSGCRQELWMRVQRWLDRSFR